MTRGFIDGDGGASIPALRSEHEGTALTWRGKTLTWRGKVLLRLPCDNPQMTVVDKPPQRGPPE